MANDNFISVNISVSGRALARDGFGLACFACYHTKYPERYRLYSDLDAVAEDFDTQDPAYIAAAGMFAQDPKPSEIMIGRRALPYTQSWELTVLDATEGSVYAFTVAKYAGATPASTDITYTVPGSATTSTVATALASALDAVTGISASSAEAVVTVEVDTAGVYWGIIRPLKFTQENLSLKNTTADPGIATDLAAIREAQGSFYGLALDSEGAAEITAAAAWAAGASVAYIPSSADTAIEKGTAGNIGLSLSALAYHRVARPFYNRYTTASFAGARILGRWLPEDPGSVSLAHKAIAGLQPDELGATAIANLKAGLISCYVNVREGTPAIHGEWSYRDCFGEWLDVVRGLDWVTSEIKYNLLSLQLGAKKIPYNQAGINAHEAAISQALAAATPVVLSEGWSSFAPKLGDISTANKALRFLPGLGFEAVLSGAITSADVRGYVTP